MKKEFIIAGFGGQGVLSMGKIFANSALMEGHEVTWFPAYGPEQRGGTANVTVIVSDERISSPIISQFDVAIILNQPSLERFEETIKPGGILFTFSCSQAIDKEMFRLAVFSAAAQVGRKVRILHQLHQPQDHPINIYHPEGEYLKGLVVYVE